MAIAAPGKVTEDDDCRFSHREGATEIDPATSSLHTGLRKGNSANRQSHQIKAKTLPFTKKKIPQETRGLWRRVASMRRVREWRHGRTRALANTRLSLRLYRQFAGPIFSSKTMSWSRVILLVFVGINLGGKYTRSFSKRRLRRTVSTCVSICDFVKGRNIEISSVPRSGLPRKGIKRVTNVF